MILMSWVSLASRSQAMRECGKVKGSIPMIPVTMVEHQWFLMVFDSRVLDM